ncbi:MAG: hypothetical protein H5U03_02070 [Clostridia bacterium]|nr:hypothetical protein [Clostridia bacterium]
MGDMVSPHLHRGTKNEILVDQAGIALLQRLEDLRKSRQMSLRQALQALKEEQDGNEDGDARKSMSEVTLSRDPSESWAVKALIEELRRTNEALQRERDYWRDLALKLQGQVEELQRLALPSPREQRPWWARRIFRWLWSS